MESFSAPRKGDWRQPVAEMHLQSRVYSTCANGLA